MSGKSKVYFAPFGPHVSKVDVLKKLIEAAEFRKTVAKGALTAVKLHFGEKGNDTYMRPIFVRAVVDEIKRCGGKPFLVDSNTLYMGSRKNAVDHLVTAIENGFGYEVTGAPLVIADGLKSNDFREVPVNGDFFKSVDVSSAIAEADALVVMSHFKGHVSAGYGGAIKNLAMGCAPARGKKAQHAVRLEADEETCIGCGRCYRNCPAHAIAMVQSGGKNVSRIDPTQCIGCCECMTVCPTKAIHMLWTGSDDRRSFNCRMAEYAWGAVKGRKRVVYINAMMDITPLCDCCGWSDTPIVPNIGFAFSTDPVALDKACYDLVTAAEGMPGEEHHFHSGDDKFAKLYPECEPHAQFEHGEKIGLGTTAYELFTLEPPKEEEE
ncbi:MAG: DUF362 domain-containing protein [Pyramidobacter sp.]|jgi:uncharacterized Fe-S center protein